MLNITILDASICSVFIDNPIRVSATCAQCDVTYHENRKGEFDNNREYILFEFHTKRLPSWCTTLTIAATA